MQRTGGGGLARRASLYSEIASGTSNTVFINLGSNFRSASPSDMVRGNAILRYLCRQLCVHPLPPCAVWAMAKAAHAKALDSLRHWSDETGMARPRHKDPECLACHTLGLGAVLTDGAVAIRLSAVGCEACHGPAQRHAAQMKLRSSAEGDAPIPSRRETRSERSSLSAVTSETCTRCHMPGKSPTFSYEEYLSVVRH